MVTSSPRRAMALVSNLPLESALATKYRGGVSWTQETELMAVQTELIYAMIRILLQGFGAKKSDIPKPWSIPRPWQSRKQARRKATAAETIKIFEGLGMGGHDG